MVYALDTNVVIALLRNNKAVSDKFDAVVETEKIIIPPYVNFEILRGFQYVSAPKKQELYMDFCGRCPVEEMNAKAWEKAAAIYGDLLKKGLAIEDADLLIASFCIVNSYTLVTNNARHFERIEGLSIEDWAE